MYVKKCGLCGQEYLSELPEGQGRLICDSSNCIARYKHAEEELRIEQQTKANERKIKREPKVLEPFLKDRKGYVYLMRSDNGLYKIGRAKNIETRLNGLNREIPIKVEVIHTVFCNNYLVAEKELHNRYAEYRVKYEWFALPETAIAEIMIFEGHTLDVGLE